MTHRTRLLLAVLLILALAAALALYMRGDLSFAQKDTAPMAPAEKMEDEIFTWSFETNDEGDTPRTKVTLQHAGETKEIGTYNGSCSEIAAENLQENQVSGVLCWWAGAGDEIGVFKEGGEYVVKVGVQEESTAESEGFRGNFDTEVQLR